MKSYSGYSDADVAAVTAVLAELGLTVTLGANVDQCDSALSSPIAARVADLHAAYDDPAVHALFGLAGGSNAIQLLRALDFDKIATHPKIFCGYSDVGTLLNAIYARTGVVGYYGPNFAGLAGEFGREHTLRALAQCLFEDAPFVVAASRESSVDGAEPQPHDGPFWVTAGNAEGTLLGGSLHSLSALQGTPFFPDLTDSILLLESPLQQGKASLAIIDAAIESLMLQPGFSGVHGLVFGRFMPGARITEERLCEMLATKPELADLPVAAGFDFGHTLPRATLPIGGRGALEATDGVAQLRVLQH
ncbi:MAG: LD-carboxypeptidase [Planctomycetota bacterium]